jgi:hypothetical protein
MEESLTQAGRQGRYIGIATYDTQNTSFYSYLSSVRCMYDDPPQKMAPKSAKKISAVIILPRQSPIENERVSFSKQDWRMMI